MWNPGTYNQFKQERYAPFFDAMAMVDRRSGMDVIDLGCGTGELTAMLAGSLEAARVTGVDASAEMLAESGAFTAGGVSFALADIAAVVGDARRYDLVFSNAALQWLPDHRSLFPRLLEMLRPDGQLLVQMPAQHRNRANILLYELAAQPPFAAALTGYTGSVSMLDPEDYAELLFRAGCRDIQVFEKIYPLIVPDVRGVYDFINGSALRPYLAALDESLRESFAGSYMDRLRAAFPQQPVFYPFKRILISARI